MSVLTLLDLSAAFDSLDYSTLLARLQVMLGMSDKAFAWSTLYLSDIRQSLSGNGRVTSHKKLHCGVPP